MNSALLDVQNLSVLLNTDEMDLPLVSKVSFDIKHGEVFGLVGESGCGKTLTALSILRILPQNIISRGEILYDRKNILKLSEDEMRRLRGKDISMIFQEPMTSLNPVLKIGYQLKEAILSHSDLSKSDSLAKSVELLKAVGIPSPEFRINDYPHQLSGGMRQRVMIAMAISCNPSLLIADEPTTALDVTIQAQILELLQHLKLERKMAIIFITHDLSIISEQADRVAIMYAGRIIELADVNELFYNPLHPYTQGLLASLPGEKGVLIKPIPGFVPNPGYLPEGCKFSERCSKRDERCLRDEPQLKEASSHHYIRCAKWQN